MQPPLTIRRAGRADFEAALAVIGRAFNLVVRAPSVHTMVAESGQGGLLVAERDGAIVGTSAYVSFGRTGWIGGVAVAEEERGRGLGRALTVAALDALGPHETVLLLASAAGRPIYERMGFVGEGMYRVFMSPDDARPTGSFRALGPADRDAVLALDARVTGESRALAVDCALAGGVAAATGVALRPPWPARPILAPDPGEGAALLAAVLEPGVRLAVPEANAAAVAALEGLGCVERAGVLRMRRGPAVDWRPTELWGVFSLFFG
ncbi:MAG TPA: GNAT family N-acetyltransferase [Myxococcota bacterium]